MKATEDLTEKFDLEEGEIPDAAIDALAEWLVSALEQEANG